jgi:cryptochrome
VRRYVPELADMPAKYIYEPWKALVRDQRKARARIARVGRADEAGVYPKPMFDFVERRAVLFGGDEEGLCCGALWG